MPGARICCRVRKQLPDMKLAEMKTTHDAPPVGFSMNDVEKLGRGAELDEQPG
jgi:hypothetical protein